MNQKNINIFRQSGLTLVELLVAAVLGLLLVGIIASMYVTSVGGFRSNNQLARVQENTRFALNYMHRSLHKAGYSQCGSTTRDFSYLINSYNSTISGGLFGWEFDGTDQGDTYGLTYADIDIDSTNTEINNAATANKGALASWVSITGAPALDELIDNYDPIVGSDIIAVTSEFERNDVEVEELTGTNFDTLELSATSDSFGEWSIIKVGNCFERNIFSNTLSGGLAAEAGTGNIPIGQDRQFPGEAFSKPWGEYDGGAYDFNIAKVYQDITTIYYVGTGASGIPSLYRMTSECGFQMSDCPAADIQVTELVEGVENLQVLYGYDSDNDGVANQYYSADQVPNTYAATAIRNAFSDVVSLRLSVLMRSIDNSEELDTETYLLADTISINPIDKPILRFVTNTTIELRNRED